MVWGARFLGFTGMMNALDQIEVQIESDAVYVVGTNVEYAVYQEFGTSQMPAQSFLRPAAQEVQQAIPLLALNHPSMDELVKAAALQVERKAKEKAPVDTGNLRNSIRTVKVK